MPELKEKQGLDKSYLSTLSPKDAKFDTHKANAVKVSQLC